MTVNGFLRFILISSCLCCLLPSYSAARPDKIRVVMENNYPPFVFKDNAGNPQGSQIDLWRLWEKKTGIKAEISLMDWAEAQSRLQDGEFDVIDKIAKTEPRSKIYDFSPPFSTIEVPVFFLKDIPGIAGAASLKGFAVGVQTGDSAIEYLNNQGVDNLLFFNNYEEIVLAAKNHKVNVMVMDKAPALYFLHKHGILGNFKQSEPLNTVSLHRAVKKGNSELLTIVEDGFRLITPHELKKIQKQWYGSSLEYTFPSTSIFAGISGLCLLVLFLFIWNRTLKNSVEKRTAELKSTEEVLRKSEEKFRKHIEGSTDVIFTLNTEGIFMYVSPAWERHFGVPVSEITGKCFSLFAHPDDLHPLLSYLHRVLSSGQAETSPPFRVICADGSWRQFEANGSTFVDPSGELLFIGVGHDITEQIEKEQALLEKEQKFRAFFEQGYYFAGLMDTDGTLTDVNNTALQFSGTEKEAVIGTPFWDTPWWSHSPELQEKLRHAVTCAASGELATFEATHPAPDGTLHYIDFSLRPVKDSSGTVLFLVPEGRDITERKKAEDERLKLERQLLHTQKLESLGILSGGIAHDFNNLLQALLGNLDLALMKLPQDTPARKNIDNAIKAGRHAAQLTNMMLAYSGKGLFVVTSLNLTELVQENATMLNAAIPKSISLEQHLDHTLPTIKADAGQLQQVIMNLITNAAEAIGNASGTITLSTGADEYDQSVLNQSLLDAKPVAGRYVWLGVRDNGCGMDDETLHKLFDPFFTTKFTGRGLGMSAVQGIIRAHNGAFLVESVLGGGTAIKVLFPTVNNQTSLPYPVIAAESAQKQAIGHALKILIVDDEDMIREVSTAMLDELGFETLAAASGEDALALFSEHRDSIGIVLLDQVMPGMDGVTVIKELRSIRPDIKVLLASGFSQQEVSERFKGLGLNGYLPKPYTLKDLTSVLTRVLKATEQ